MIMLAQLGQRSEEAVREEAEIRPDAGEQFREHRALEDAERVIQRQDRRPAARNSRQVDFGDRVARRESQSTRRSAIEPPRPSIATRS